MRPGAIALTRMPNRPFSAAATRVRASTPAFAAEYAAPCSAVVSYAAIELMLTMAPDRWACMIGRA